MNSTYIHKEKSTSTQEMLIWKHVINMMHSHEIWQNSTKKTCNPQKGVALLPIPLNPTRYLREKVKLYLLHYETMVAIPTLQHMNLQFQITPKP
jgi:hypothetical protein